MKCDLTVICNNYFGLPVVDAYIGPVMAGLSQKENAARLKQRRKLRCCFDTGANCTAINQKTAQELGEAVKQNGVTMLSPNAVTKTSQYTADILLPNDMVICQHPVNVIESPIDIFVGMDIIGIGDFALTTRNGQKLLSFVVPHQIEIDFQTLT